MLRYENLTRSAGPKKWVSATPAADHGDSQALWVPPKVPYAYGIAVGAALLHNRSGTSVQAGLGARYPVTVWEAGALTAAGAYTADTVDAQDVDTNDFVLHNRADSGSGFLVGCDVPFNCLGVIQGTAGDQTTPVLIVEYWNGAAWVDIVGSALIADDLNAGTGEKLLVFPQPSDWARGGSGTGVPAGRFNLRVRQTHGGAGTTNPAATQMFVGQAKMMVEALADNATFSLIREHEYLFERVADALFPIFSAAHRGNIVEVDVRAY